MKSKLIIIWLFLICVHVVNAQNNTNIILGINQTFTNHTEYEPDIGWQAGFDQSKVLSDKFILRKRSGYIRT